MLWMKTLLLGREEFAEHEEYLEFRCRMLTVLMFFGCVSGLLFGLGHHLDLNPFHGRLAWSFRIHVGGGALLLVLLRGHKDRFPAVAWAYAGLSFLQFVMAFLYVPEDELRALWFFLNLPALYVLLGPRVGVGATVLSLATVLLLNRVSARPYSVHALATGTMGFAYVGAFFLAYARRSYSFFERLLASHAQLRHLAAHDPLTGLLNARAYYGACERLAATGAADIPHAVLFVDLDHFKRINDTWGHQAGDAVLVAVSTCLSAHLRTTDLLGRIGGEEFSIFLPGTDQEGALRLAEKLRAAVETLQPDIGGTTLPVTASLGVASRRGPFRLAALQAEADQAMYEAKRQGRNRVSALALPDPSA